RDVGPGGHPGRRERRLGAGFIPAGRSRRPVIRTTVSFGCAVPVGAPAPSLPEFSTRTPEKVHPIRLPTGVKHCSGKDCRWTITAWGGTPGGAMAAFCPPLCGEEAHSVGAAGTVSRLPIWPAAISASVTVRRHRTGRL